jgi:HemX protein
MYGISAVYSLFLWRHGFKNDNRVNYILLLTGFLFHSTAMFLRGFSFSRCPINNLYEATLFIVWTMVAAYLAVGMCARLRFLGAFSSPVLFAIGVFALMPALDMPGTKPVLSHVWRSLHATTILLACGAFGLGAVSSLMFLTQDHNLRFNKALAFTSLFPPIQRLERTTTILLAAAAVLLSAGLAIGMLALTKATRETQARSDPFINWSILLWFFYCALCVAYWRRWLRGRRLAWGMLGGFVFLMFTFWGFYLLSPVHRP